MSIIPKLEWHDLEKLVADTIVDDAYGDCDTEERQRRYLRELAQAQRELEKLGRRENVDYGLPRMGEAYALQYHLRRTAGVFRALCDYTEDLASVSPSGQWRVLDIGSGTGAGSMAWGYWMHRYDLSMHASRQTRILCVEPEDRMIEVADLILRRFSKAVHCEIPLLRHDKRVRELSQLDRLSGIEYFEVALFSTTFDYMPSAEERSTVIREIFRALARVMPSGLALFSIPSVGEKAVFAAELQKAFEADPQWFRLQNPRSLPAQVPQPGEHQPHIAAARSFFIAEGRRLGLQLDPFVTGAEPVYKSDSGVLVFKKVDPCSILTGSRRRAARQIVESRR